MDKIVGVFISSFRIMGSVTCLTAFRRALLRSEEPSSMPSKSIVSLLVRPRLSSYYNLIFWLEVKETSPKGSGGTIMLLVGTPTWN